VLERLEGASVEFAEMELARELLDSRAMKVRTEAEVCNIFIYLFIYI